MNYERQDIKRLKKPKVEIKPWTIYLWRRGDKMEGASPVVTKDGIKSIYAFGWEIEKIPDAKRNELKHQEWRAKVNVKNLLNNTLNVINWYGKKVLDRQGNIDPMKFQQLEAAAAYQAVQNKVDMDDLYKIRKFPVKEITLEKAREYNFI
ncbi:MAG: hypothetical protein H7831_15820 [Magnetococcus sp. WYHC-3]